MSQQPPEPPRPLDFIERVDLAYDCLGDIIKSLSELERVMPNETNRNLIKSLTSVQKLVMREEHINASKETDRPNHKGQGAGGAATA